MNVWNPYFSTYPPVSVSGTGTLLLKVVRAFPGSILFTPPCRHTRVFTINHFLISCPGQIAMDLSF